MDITARYESTICICLKIELCTFADKVAVDEEVVAEGSAAVTVNPKQETPTPPTGGYYPAPSVKPDVTPDEEVTAPEEEEALSPFEGLEKFKARSKMTTLKGKKAIKLTWSVPEGVDYDGFEVFRSTKRYSGFGTKPFWTTTKTSYTNNKGLEEGKTYYYKVRAFKVVNGEKVYSGMVVGQSAKPEDIEINVCKKKQLTNTRSSSADEALRLTPKKVLSLEQALEFIDTDELLEVTPTSLRIRKKILDPTMRKRANR